MRFLLDTHAAIWYFEDSPQLSQKVNSLIDNPEISIFISSASLWEIAIKMSLGKLGLGMSFKDFLNSIRTRDFEILQIEDEYLEVLLTLPQLHKDPFDRLIISTAIADNLTIITIDENIKKYNVPWIW